MLVRRKNGYFEFGSKGYKQAAMLQKCNDVEGQARESVGMLRTASACLDR